MKTLTLVALLALAAFAVAPSASATCTPRGYVLVGPDLNLYDYIGDGYPSYPYNSDCWYLSSAGNYNGSTSCPYTDPYFELFYSGEVSQTFSVRSDDTSTGWGLYYKIDFVDPLDSSSNHFSVTVRDLTTATDLASESFNGATTELACSTRHLTWSSGNIAGHTLQVRFLGTRIDSSVHIRIRRIELYNSTY